MRVNRRKIIALASGLTAILAVTRSANSPLLKTSAIANYDAALDQMIGRMLVMGFQGASPSSPGVQLISDWLRQGAIGGIIFFADNLTSPAAVLTLIHYFRSASPEQPLFCVDQEGGEITRLRSDHGFAPLPSARHMATLSPTMAASFYEQTAAELRYFGFNVNFGPVVDLSLNPDNRIITGLGRSYGPNAYKVIEYSKLFINAHRNHRVLTSLKHFPGQGSARTDSHISLPNISSTWQPAELLPFMELINNNSSSMVMVGHLVHSALTEPDRPASLSPRAIQGLLRGRLSFGGIVVSDDMQMGALTHHFSPDECILLGIEAGLDLFIYSNREHPDPDMPGRFHRVIKAAIRQGRISPRRIEDSVRRIKQALEF